MKKWQVYVVMLVIISFIGFCKDEGSSSSNSDDTSTVSGAASKGPIAGGTVDAYSLDNDGNQDEHLGSGTTSSDGSYEFDIDSTDGAVELVISGGSYTDEATGEIIELDDSHKLHCIVTDISEDIAITPLTDIATARTISLLSDGSITDLEAALQNASNDVAEIFGLPVGLDIFHTLPADLTDNAGGHADAALAYGAVLAGFSNRLDQINSSQSDQLHPFDLIHALALDYTADGSIDGDSGDLAEASGLGDAYHSVTGSFIGGMESATEDWLANSEHHETDYSIDDLEGFDPCLEHPEQCTTPDDGIPHDDDSTTTNNNCAEHPNSVECGGDGGTGSDPGTDPNTCTLNEAECYCIEFPESPNCTGAAG